MAKKKQNYHSFYEDGIRYMECSICGVFEENINNSTTKVVCSDCFAKKALNLWDPTENAKTGPKKAKGWQEVASLLSSPRRQRGGVNLSDIEKNEEGEIVVVPGKVLSMGELTKKVKVVAVGFSSGAKEKLLKSKHEISTVLEEIGKNPDAKGVKILK